MNQNNPKLKSRPESRIVNATNIQNRGATAGEEVSNIESKQNEPKGRGTKTESKQMKAIPGQNGA